MDPEVQIDTISTAKQRKWIGYTVALFVEAVLIALNLLLESYFPEAYFRIPQILTIGAIAYIFGLGPAVAAFLLALLGFSFVYVHPLHSIWPLARTSSEWAIMVVFIFGGAATAIIMDMLRRSNNRIHSLAVDLRKFNNELEERVVERTTQLQAEINERRQAEESLHESERRYSALFANKTNGIAHCRVVTDESGEPVDYVILEVNDAYQEITGIKKGDVEGKLATKVFPGIENFSFDYIGNYGKIALEGGELYFETFFETLEQWLSIYIYSPKRGEFITIFTDITPQKEAEEELHKAREEADRRASEIESFMTSIVDGVTVVDGQGNIVFLNKEGRELLGIPDGENLQNWFDFTRVTLDGQIIPTSETATMRALHGEVVKDMTHKWTLPWREVTISVSASPVVDSEGRIVGVTNTFRDVTERVEFEKRQEKLLEHEQRISDILQNVILAEPEKDIACCEVAVKYQPALEEAHVGGDFYDIFNINEKKHGILIGDVAGKGLAAARQVAAVRHAVRNYSYLDLHPNKTMSLANNAVARETIEEAPMVTAFFAVVDAGQGEVAYTNAGHENVLLIRANRKIEELSIPGIALGVVCEYEYHQNSRQLQPGDTLVMITDGITEARTVPTKLFGIEGVKRCIAETYGASPEDIAEKILQSAREFGGGMLRDDAAIVVFRFSRLDGDSIGVTA